MESPINDPYKQPLKRELIEPRPDALDIESF